MNIWYSDTPVFFGNPTTVVWLAGTLVPNPAVVNGYVVQKPNGKYETFGPDGVYSDGDEMGAYQTVTLDPALPLLRVDSTVPNHPDMHLAIAWKAR